MVIYPEINRKFLCLFIMVSLVLFFSPVIVSAASLTSLSDTVSRLEKSQASNHTIKFTTGTGAGDATDTIVITMPTGFTIGSVDYADIDLSHGASTGYETEETLAAVAGSSAWGAAFSGQILTLTHPSNAANGDIAASDKVIVEIGTNASGGTRQITNHATAATYTISIDGTFGDTGKVAVVVLDSDQVTVNAVVDPSMTFTISAASTNFGTILTGSVKTSSPNINLVLGSNSSQGYSIAVKDNGNGSNPGLYNTSADKLIGSADSSYGDVIGLVGGTEGYGIQASSSDATIGSRYDGTSDEVGGLEISGTLPTLASYSSHQTASHTITVTHKAAISSSTEAGVYADTITYIATGNF